ncbi:MAG TPA: enoyl-CoA hydratase-related protein, partial [Longimicrobiaceae bacterium]|nr:enoyl-CoA hydratase-related protein [Longimicrobiaceae bacterium]
MSKSDDRATPQAVTLSINDGIATIRLNQTDRPVNVLSRDLVAEMEAVISRLESDEPDVRGVVIVSGKDGVWIAGADIEEFTEIESAADGERMSRAGHELLARLQNLGIPIVAAIDGVALGGGLELALACTYRIATDDRKTKLGLPEVQLGIIPGAGGSQRLPRLVGIRAALDLILTSKQLDARRARKIGLVDEVVPSAVLLSAASRAAAELAAGTRSAKPMRPKGSPQWLENLPVAKGFIFRKAREGVMSKTRGLYPAPLRALEVVEEGIDLPLRDALELEARAFGELSVTPESRSLIHLFFATTAAKSSPDLEEDAESGEIDRLAVVGAGFMGAAIAAVSAEKGIRVRLKDVTPEAVAKGLGTARASLVKRARKRKRPEHEITQLTDRVEATSEYTGFRSTDLVIEAVFEDVDLKHRVIKEIEAASGDMTVLGSNTSTIPIARLA